MSESKHTPGPWEVAKENIIYIKKGDRYIATVHSLEDGKNNAERLIETDANADLIARAPVTKAERDKALKLLRKVKSHLGLYSQKAIQNEVDQFLNEIAKEEKSQ